MLLKNIFALTPQYHYNVRARLMTQLGILSVQVLPYAVPCRQHRDPIMSSPPPLQNTSIVLKYNVLPTVYAHEGLHSIFWKPSGIGPPY